MNLLAALLILFTSSAADTPVDDCTQLVERLVLPAQGTIVQSTDTLETRVYHRLVVKGFFKKEGPGFADAKWAFNAKLSMIYERCSNLTTGVLMGVSAGTTADNGVVLNWGKFSPRHTYTAEIMGKERHLYLRYADCDLKGNSGSLNVELYRCNRRAPIQ